MTTLSLDAHSESLDHQTCVLCGHTPRFPGNLIHGTVTRWGQVIGVVAAKDRHFQSVCQRTAHTSNASDVCWNVERLSVCSRMRKLTYEAVSIGPYVPAVDLVFTWHCGRKMLQEIYTNVDTNSPDTFFDGDSCKAEKPLFTNFILCLRASERASNRTVKDSQHLTAVAEYLFPRRYCCPAFGAIALHNQ
jgi:hypothetical protein